MAERAGFEPAVEFVTLHTISNRAPSARLGHLSACATDTNSKNFCCQVVKKLKRINGICEFYGFKIVCVDVFVAQLVFFYRFFRTNEVTTFI